MKTRFMQSKSMRMRLRDKDQRIRGGKLYPVMIEPFKQSEGGILAQSIEVDVDPVVGRLESKMFAHVVSIFVPAIAMEELKYPSSSTADYADAFRDKHIAGMVFDLEEENELSKRMCVNPRSISGVKMVNEVANLGHNVAVNFLRRRKYVRAPQLDANSTAITPALLSDTSLERFNAVLDPDDTINGAVNLSGDVPVLGLGIGGPSGTQPLNSAQFGVNQSDGSTGPFEGWVQGDSNLVGNVSLYVESAGPGSTSDHPNIRASFSGASDSPITLAHFWQAEQQNKLIREMDDIVRNNPEHGEEMVASWAFGLQVDMQNLPQIIYDRELELGDNIRNATDGDNLDVEQTETGIRLSFTKLVPKTEFGGVVITFVALKPDEVLAQQPDPILSDVWEGKNFASEELILDPQKVTARDLWSDVPTNNEGDVMMYVGHNNLHRSFVDYGFAKTVDTNAVANKNKIWRLEIPLTVSPSSILYPDDIGHYPWFDQSGDIAWVRCRSQQTVKTPMMMGATPIETNEAISDAIISFHDHDGEVQHTVSLPIGRHDLSRYNPLLDAGFTLENIKVVSIGNAAETMTYPVDQMLKTSANQLYIPPMEGAGPVERRYAVQIQQRIAKNRDLRDEDARHQRIHRAKAEKILAQRQLESDEQAARVLKKQERQRDLDIEKDLIENDKTIPPFKSELEVNDGEDKDNPKVIPIKTRNKRGDAHLGVRPRWSLTTPASALNEKPAQPARAPIFEVYTLSGCATVSTIGDIPALRNR